MRLRPALIVALSSVSILGCGSAEPVPGNLPGNPPPPPPREKPPLEVATAQPSTVVATSNPPPPPLTRTSGGPFTKAKNSYHPTHGMIYRGAKDCLVHVSDGKQRPPGSRLPSLDVPCPKEMSSAVWKECLGETVMANEAGDRCECFVSGNPPGPPLPMSRCP